MTELTPEQVAAVVNLLGCEWGRAIFAAVDTSLCHAQAVQRVALHDKGEAWLVQLCGPHRDIVLAETTPRSRR